MGAMAGPSLAASSASRMATKSSFTLSEKLGTVLPFDTIEELRAAMALDCPDLATLGLTTFAWNAPALDAKAEGAVGYPIKDFYLTNAICRASPTMQRCSAELVHGQAFAEAAE
eukprot:gene30153-40046_t